MLERCWVTIFPGLLSFVRNAVLMAATLDARRLFLHVDNNPPASKGRLLQKNMPARTFENVCTQKQQRGNVDGR